MRILAIGDFHGKFPKRINQLIKKEKIDLVISTGDYPPFAYRKLWFKHCYAKDTELWEIIGKNKYKKLVKEDLKKGEIPLKFLNNLPIPVFTVLGNIDYPQPNDVADMNSSSLKSKRKNQPNWDKADEFSKRLKKYKNIKRFDYKAIKFQDYVFIGMRGHSFPGKVKSKAYKKHKLKLEKLFTKYKKENKNNKVIFVSHNVPYNTKLDKIISKDANKLVKGEHYGSKLCRRIINKFQPIITIGGHIHEAKGKDKVKDTICINPGAIHEGNATIIELRDNKKPKIKFLD